MTPYTMVCGFKAGDCLEITSASSRYYVLWLDAAIQKLVFVVRLDQYGQVRKTMNSFDRGIVANFLGSGILADGMLNQFFVKIGQSVVFSKLGERSRHYTSVVARVRRLLASDKIDQEIVRNLWLQAVSRAPYALVNAIIGTFFDVYGIVRAPIFDKFQNRIARDDFLRILYIVGQSVNEGTLERVIVALGLVWQRHFESAPKNITLQQSWLTLEAAAGIVADTVRG